MTRSASEIGAGLAPARPARPIPVAERIHVIGAAGAGASAAVLLAAGSGAIVTACDAGAPSPYTAAIEAQGITVVSHHDLGHVISSDGPLVDRVAVSKAITAVAPDLPELAAALAEAIPIESWQQLVADAAATAGQMLVGVAGTHGKSTTTGWLLHVLVQSGRDPSGFVGALMAGEGPADRPATARLGGGAMCVVEADEYAGNFDPYRPSVAILLNAEWDHPDVFADERAVLDVFEAWVRLMASDASGRPPTLVVDVADAGAAAVATRLADWPGTIVRVGLGQDGGQSDGALRDSALDLQGRLVARGPNGIELEVEGRLLSAVNDGQRRMRVPLALPGRHNAANAVCVIAAALVLGIAPADVAATIGSYRGVGRRLELKGEPDGVLVLDDYAHHPSAIRATLAAVREAYPGRPVWAVYEPLTYHRTAAMLDAFAEVLSTADRAVIADIWAGRDPDRTVVSAADLAEAISARGSQPALATGSPEATADRLAELVRPEDIVLVMGGGRSYVIAERLVTRLAERPSSRPTSAA